MKARAWDGRDVNVINMGTGNDRRSIEISLTEDAARKLAIVLSKSKQIYFMTPPEIEELLQALNYVVVGGKNSKEAHRVMEAGKGMTPDGGHKAPERYLVDGGHGGNRGSEWRDRLPESGRRYE